VSRIIVKIKPKQYCINLTTQLQMLLATTGTK